jgi:glyoxylase-like metal-dependent hydrolase (beta-lactamase superfamily II)
VTRIDDHTFAIAEPRYDQHNLDYLIVGDTRALLFDTGPGVRDIRPLVASLTDRPVTAAFSHLHFDHIGGQAEFASVASLDHPSIRSRVANDERFTPTLALYDAERGQLFSGDYLYPGDLFAFGPGSDLAAYRDTAQRLLALTAQRPDLAIYGAHVSAPSASPRQHRSDLERLAAALDDLLADRDHALPWTLAWFEWIPTRRHAFGDGLVILLPIF